MLDGKRVLVVGATSGIGEAIFRLAARSGAELIGIGRRAETGRALAEECGGSFHTLDITDDAALDAFFAGLAAQGLKLDGAVNSAAMTQDAEPIDTMDAATFDRLFALNVRALFRCLQHEMRSMRSMRGSKGGSIVNIGSIAGKRGFAGLAAYTASKHAVAGITKSAALDGAADGIRVNALLPGTTRTEMFEKQMQTRPGGEEATVAAIPLGRTAQPDEQAEAACWLLSDRSSFVTGEELTVDGGRTIA